MHVQDVILSAINGLLSYKILFEIGNIDFPKNNPIFLVVYVLFKTHII